jgi:uncharacterized protein involved in exopolysaccharide biosynthesis
MYPSGTQDPGKIDFFQLLRILWSWKLVIAGCLLASQALIAYKSFATPKRYSAESKFIFKEGQKANSNFGNLAMMMGLGSALGEGSDLANFFDIIIYTDDFLRHILDRKWSTGTDSATLEQIWKVHVDTAGPEGAYRKFRVLVGKLAGGEYILVKKQEGIINLTTQFEYPQVTYDVNAFIISKLNDYLLNNTQSQARANRKFVEQRLKEISSELYKSEEGLLSFNLRNQNPTSPALVLEMARLRRAVEINQEVYLQLKKQLEMAKIEETKENALIEVLASPRYPLGPDQAVSLKQRIILTMGGAFLGIILAIGLHFALAAYRRPR